MSQQQHIIGRTVLEIDSDRLEDMWSFQQEISDIFQQKAIPAMEQLFEQLVEADEVIRLERVEVELDPINRHYLADEFLEKLLAALRRILSDRRPSPLPLNPQTENWRDDHPPPLREPLSVTGESEVSKRDGAASDWEILLYFLQYGRLPWWCLWDDSETAICQWEKVMQQGKDWQRPLRELLMASTSARQRLIAQFREAFRHQIVLQLQPTWGSWPRVLTQARQLMEALSMSDRSAKILETEAWLWVWLELGRNSSAHGPFPLLDWLETWLSHLLKRITSEGLLIPEEVISSDNIDNFPQPPLRTQARRIIPYSHLQSLIESIAVTDTSVWLKALEQAMLLVFGSVPQQSRNNQPKKHREQSKLAQNQQSQNPKSNFQPSLTSEEVELNQKSTEQSPEANITEMDRLSGMGVNEVRSSSLRSGAIAQKFLTPFRRYRTEVRNQKSEVRSQKSEVRNQIDNLEQGTEQSSLSPEELEIGLFIQQSGLVILHPFLQPYFETVGLLQEKQFLNRMTQETAIYLLYYLATGQTEAPEYELVLPKLLCGWPLNEPVTPPQAFPETALTEAEHLLETVITYWSVLKHTSPDGLREGFLQRGGKLTLLNQGDWRLQVEQTAIDVLLSRLPWGINVIKLPWMETLLMVEWN